ERDSNSGTAAMTASSFDFANLTSSGLRRGKPNGFRTGACRRPPVRSPTRRSGGVVSVADDPLPLMFDVHPGREVIFQGEPYPDAWVIRYGALLMEVVDADGHRLALDVLGPGDLVGGPSGWTADASVRAVVTSGLFAAGTTALRDGLARRARRASW